MTAGVPISKRLVLINSASSVAAQALSVTVLVWMHQYLLRRISAEEYSLLPVVMAVMVFMPLLSTVLTAGLGRYVVEAYARGDERRVTQIVSTMFPLLLGTALIVVAIGWTFAWHAHRVLTVAPDRVWDARLMFGLLMFSAAVRLPLTPFGLGLYVHQKFVLSNLLHVCAEFLRIGLLFVFLLGIGTQIKWVVVASVTSQLCHLVVLTLISMRMMPSLRFRPREIRRRMSRELTSFGAWSVLAQLSEMIRNAANPLILNKFATAVDVTCYHLGEVPFQQIRQASSLVQRPLMPVLTAMHATGDAERLRNTYLRFGPRCSWRSRRWCTVRSWSCSTCKSGGQCISRRPR